MHLGCILLNPNHPADLPKFSGIYLGHINRIKMIFNLGIFSLQRYAAGIWASKPKMCYLLQTNKERVSDTKIFSILVLYPPNFFWELSKHILRTSCFQIFDFRLKNFFSSFCSLHGQKFREATSVCGQRSKGPSNSKNTSKNFFLRNLSQCIQDV